MVGDPWHRMTWIALTDGDSPFVIKDSYRSEDSSFIEGELFDILHEEGLVSGFPDIVDSFEVVDDDGRDLIVKVRKCKRTKTRLVMATSGDPLHHCPSVLALLKVMYDVLECHRFAVGKKNILHRDISFANILINPRFAREVDPEEAYRGDDAPRFITQVLDKKGRFATALALLIDFDSAAEYLRNLAKSPHYVRLQRLKQRLDKFRERTGTPRYIARSVASGRVLVNDMQFVPMPTLDGAALDRYKTAHSTDGFPRDPLRTFEDDGSTMHGGVFEQATRNKYRHNCELQYDNYEHHPRHDAESVFWCIIAFLLQAMPLEPENPEDVNNASFNDFWRCLADHEIRWKSARDSRNEVFQDIDNFADYLHEDLYFVAPLLYELAEQVRPEYALLDPPPHPLHLHEAMQRILFKYIHKWEVERCDVKLSINSVRPTIAVEKKERAPVKLPTYNGQNPSKRAADAVEKLEMSQAKRQRIDSGYTSNASLSDASSDDTSSDEDEL